MAVLLQASHVTMQFGGLKAVNDVDMEIQKGEVHALIGPNDAGKTTFFNIVSGIYTPTSGYFDLDAAVVYDVVKNYLPFMLATIKKIRKEL